MSYNEAETRFHLIYPILHDKRQGLQQTKTQEKAARDAHAGSMPSMPPSTI